MIGYLPLYQRNGDIRAFAIVDAVDFEWLKAYRWSLDSTGYPQRALPGKPRKVVRMHREILGLTSGDGRQADHINRDRLDNRRSNLRVVTKAQNMQNVPGIPTATSRFRGVHWHKQMGKWCAQASVNRQCHHLGLFADELEAASAVHAFRAEHLPFAEPDPAIEANLAKFWGPR